MYYDDKESENCANSFIILNTDLSESQGCVQITIFIYIKIPTKEFQSPAFIQLYLNSVPSKHLKLYTLLKYADDIS